MEARKSDTKRVVHNSTIVSYDPHKKDNTHKVSGGPKPPPEKRSH